MYMYLLNKYFLLCIGTLVTEKGLLDLCEKMTSILARIMLFM